MSDKQERMSVEAWEAMTGEQYHCTFCDGRHNEEDCPNKCATSQPSSEPRADYLTDLRNRLADDDYAVEYLLACAKEGKEAMRVALRDVRAAAKRQGEGLDALRILEEAKATAGTESAWVDVWIPRLEAALRQAEGFPPYVCANCGHLENRHGANGCVGYHETCKCQRFTEAAREPSGEVRRLAQALKGFSAQGCAAEIFIKAVLEPSERDYGAAAQFCTDDSIAVAIIERRLETALANYSYAALSAAASPETKKCPDCGHRAHAGVSCLESDCCGCGQ